MKKSLLISILALIVACAALYKVMFPCQKTEAAKAAETADMSAQVEKVLNEKPEIIFNAMQAYQVKAQEEALKAANQLIKDNIEAVNNDPTSPVVGNKDGEIVLVEFFDYACGFCHRLFPELNEVMANNSDVKFVFKPLAFVSEYSEYAARAALAASLQGKFVEMHNALFTVEGPLNEDKINELAAKIGLDVEKLKADAKGEEVSAMMSANNDLAGKIQVNGVPTLILNGEFLQSIDGAQIQESISNLKK